MKALITQIATAAALMLLSQTALATGGGTVPDGNGRGNRLQCRAYDTGHEEHGSHYSCGSCLDDHSQCEERCYSYSYSCTAQGETPGLGGSQVTCRVEAYSTSGSSFQKNKVYYASANYEYEAERSALRQCENDPTSYGCSVDTCFQESVGGGTGGSLEKFQAEGYNEIRAKERALQRCYDAGGRNCHILSCDEDSYLESRTMCPQKKKRQSKVEPQPRKKKKVVKKRPQKKRKRVKRPVGGGIRDEIDRGRSRRDINDRH